MLVEGDLLVEVARFLIAEGRRVAALAREARPPLLPELAWQAMPSDPEGYAHALYDALRILGYHTVNGDKLGSYPGADDGATLIRQIDAGDCSGPKSARRVLANPAVTTAVFEAARAPVT